MTTLDIIRKTKAAWSALWDADAETKNRLLTAMADSLVDHTAEILACNETDLEAARGHISDVMLDRLRLAEGRIAAMAEGIRATVKLPDHTGRILSETHHANGMTIYKKQVPLGLVAIIYESRPNVTSDAAALTVKSGNVCVLRSGKEAVRTSTAIVKALKQGISAVGGDPDIVNILEDTSHESARVLMTADGLVDLLIPRGGAGLIRACVEQATVPCIQTGTGICHVYVDEYADLDKAVKNHCQRQNQPPLRVQRRGGVSGSQRRGGAVSAHAAEGTGRGSDSRGADPRGAAAGPKGCRRDSRNAGRPGRFRHGIFGLYSGSQSGGQRGRGNRAHSGPLHPPQRGHRDGERRQRGEICQWGGQRGGVRQRLHPVH